MRIAQVAPLYESVPPKGYGGTERVVSYLTEELVRQGHQVTLFASGDSVTSARLVAACPRALRLDDQCEDQLAHCMVLIEQVLQQAPAFDVIHFHIDYLHFPPDARHLSGVSRTCLTGKGLGAGHYHRSAGGYAAEDRRQGGSGRPGIF